MTAVITAGQICHELCQRLEPHGREPQRKCFRYFTFCLIVLQMCVWRRKKNKTLNACYWLFLKESGLVIKRLIYHTFFFLVFFVMNSFHKMFIPVSNNKLNSITQEFGSYTRSCAESGNYSIHLLGLIIDGWKLPFLSDVYKGTVCLTYCVSIRLESTVHTVGRPKKSAYSPEH